jgi:hypothetical protein
MTLASIKSAIEELPEEEKGALIDWLLSLDREQWDKQIADDFSPGGRGASLLDKVDDAIDRGDFKKSIEAENGY